MMKWVGALGVRCRNYGSAIVSQRADGQLVRTARRPPQTSSYAQRAAFSTYTGDDDEHASATHAFDRPFKTRQRSNAARAHAQWRDNYNNNTNSRPSPVAYDYMRDEIAARLVDRLDDIKHDDLGFPLALDIGSGAGHVHRAICAEPALGEHQRGGMGGVQKLVQLDSSHEMLHRDVDSVPVEGGELCETYRLVGDEEDTLPFPDGTFDLVISSGSLHWVNDLPAVLKEAKRVLKPDGCIMLAMVGGTTLPELRVSMVLAEMEREGGVSPHVGPFVGLSDVGGLLQSAGFTLPTLDVDTVKITFPNAPTLMEHLQRMGESNACIKRKSHTGLDTLLAASCLYDEMYGVHIGDAPLSDDGTPMVDATEVEATINVIYAIGWSPHESQQKPLERGTATHRITDISSESKEGNA